MNKGEILSLEMDYDGEEEIVMTEEVLMTWLEYGIESWDDVYVNITHLSAWVNYDNELQVSVYIEGWPVSYDVDVKVYKNYSYYDSESKSINTYEAFFNFGYIEPAEYLIEATVESAYYPGYGFVDEEATIFVHTAPEPSGDIIINDGDQYTNSRNVTLDLPASNADEMRIRNEGDNWSWENYSSSKSWTLPDQDEEHTVEVQFRNDYGETSSVYDDSIVLDREPPEITHGWGTSERYINDISDVILSFSDPNDNLYKVEYKIYTKENINDSSWGTPITVNKYNEPYKIGNGDFPTQTSFTIDWKNDIINETNVFKIEIKAIDKAGNKSSTLIRENLRFNTGGFYAIGYCTDLSDNNPIWENLNSDGTIYIPPNRVSDTSNIGFKIAHHPSFGENWIKHDWEAGYGIAYPENFFGDEQYPGMYQRYGWNIRSFNLPNEFLGKFRVGIFNNQSTDLLTGFHYYEKTVQLSSSDANFPLGLPGLEPYDGVMLPQSANYQGGEIISWPQWKKIINENETIFIASSIVIGIGVTKVTLGMNWVASSIIGTGTGFAFSYLYYDVITGTSHLYPEGTKSYKKTVPLGSSGLKTYTRVFHQETLYISAGDGVEDAGYYPKRLWTVNNEDSFQIKITNDQDITIVNETINPFQNTAGELDGSEIASEIKNAINDELGGSAINIDVVYEREDNKFKFSSNETLVELTINAISSNNYISGGSVFDGKSFSISPSSDFNFNWQKPVTEPVTMEFATFEENN